jgi:hypothetical protein
MSLIISFFLPSFYLDRKPDVGPSLALLLLDTE